MYIRFDPEPLKPYLDASSSPKLIHEAARSCSLWNQTVSPFILPPGISIMMGDVCGGSSSTSMAGTVMTWMKENRQQSSTVWATLAEANKSIYEGLQELIRISKDMPEKYRNDIETAANLTSEKWPTQVDASGSLEILTKLRKLFKRTRFWLKRLGDDAKVGIEPEAQTALADRTESLAGVLCAGVPGAGGNDAIYAIILSDATRDNVERVWSQWETSIRGKTYGTAVCPLLLSAENSSRFGVLNEPPMPW
jgi:phosphomevalonate kinase